MIKNVMVIKMSRKQLMHRRKIMVFINNRSQLEITRKEVLLFLTSMLSLIKVFMCIQLGNKFEILTAKIIRLIHANPLLQFS